MPGRVQSTFCHTQPGFCCTTFILLRYKVRRPACVIHISGTSARLVTCLSYPSGFCRMSVVQPPSFVVIHLSHLCHTPFGVRPPSYNALSYISCPDMGIRLPDFCHTRPVSLNRRCGQKRRFRLSHRIPQLGCDACVSATRLSQCQSRRPFAAQCQPRRKPGGRAGNPRQSRTPQREHPQTPQPRRPVGRRVATPRNGPVCRAIAHRHVAMTACTTGPKLMSSRSDAGGRAGAQVHGLSCF